MDKKKITRFTPLESVLNIYDDRVWYYIEGYNGYEISNDNIIRSMKHYKQYPYGILIQPKKDRHGNVINLQDPVYVLTNNNNDRIELNISSIRQIALSSRKMTGYPRRTCNLDIASRNQRCFIATRNKLTNKPSINKETFFPKFNIIKEK